MSESDDELFDVHDFYNKKLIELARRPPMSFQFKIISDAAKALLHISKSEYKKAYDIMVIDYCLRKEYVEVNELKSELLEAPAAAASPNDHKRKSKSSGGKLTRKAYAKRSVKRKISELDKRCKRIK